MVAAGAADRVDDSITLSGTLPVPAGFAFAGKTLALNAGGVTKTFTFDAKGKSTPKSTDTATLSAPKNGISKYTIKLTKGNFTASLADEGMTSRDAKSEALSVFVRINFNAQAFEKTQPQTYSAKKGKTGTTK